MMVNFFKVTAVITFLFTSQNEFQTKESIRYSDPLVCNIETKEVCSYNVEKDMFYNCANDY